MGFTTMMGVGISMMYSCSLNIHSLAIVKYNKTDSYIRTKMEPFLLGVPIVIALLFGAPRLFTRGYNSDLGGTCLPCSRL
mmetsp:Transcript_12439/g.22443  ORF Transcript_12439/g.22443 Transcript_12439/m.22443 type:complete len:80 (-) Transcript_12439:856-1095(-)